MRPINLFKTPIRKSHSILRQVSKNEDLGFTKIYNLNLIITAQWSSSLPNFYMHEINQVDLAENWHDRIVKFEKYYTLVSLDNHFHPL